MPNEHGNYEPREDKNGLIHENKPITEVTDQEIIELLTKFERGYFSIKQSQDKGYLGSMTPYEPETDETIKKLIFIKSEYGYVSFTTAPSGASRTYSPTIYTFGITDKGKEYLQQREHLAGYDIATQDPHYHCEYLEALPDPVCTTCWHPHPPAEHGGCHLD